MPPRVSALVLLLVGAAVCVPIQDDVDEEDFSGAASNLIANLQEQIKDLQDRRAVVDKELDTIKIANQIELTALREEIENLRYICFCFSFYFWSTCQQI
jgi:malate synthase